MEKKEIKPLFGELWKQLKVVCHISADIGKALVDRVEKTASKKVKGNPITTLIVTNLISAVFVNYYVNYYIINRLQINDTPIKLRTSFINDFFKIDKFFFGFS